MEGSRCVSLGEEEAAEALIREVISDRFELRIGVPDSCAIRLLGPRELAQHGPRLLRRHRVRWPDVPIMALTAENPPADLVRELFRAGAADVIGPEELATSVVRAIERSLALSSTGRDRETETQLMAKLLGRRARELEAALVTVRESYDQTLTALVTALDCRERETACHSQRVSVYAMLLGVRTGLQEPALEELYRGSLLHDIGKIGIPDSILLKPGSLTEEEWDVMRGHTEIGGAILSGISFLSAASDVPLCHHEAWDGSGYPRGLSGDGIPLNARIFAVVDSYDAIRSERPYKAAKDHETALELLLKAADQRLDPTLVKLFLDEDREIWFGLASAASSSVGFEAAVRTCRDVAGL